MQAQRTMAWISVLCRGVYQTLMFWLMCYVASYLCASSATVNHASNTQLIALQSCKQSQPLGMISGAIHDSQVTSSSVYPAEWDGGCAERNARLYLPNRLAWCARYKTPSEWLQVDLGVLTKVTSVMTQGRGDGKEWVTSFMVSYSTFDINHWQYVTDRYGNRKVFEGNTDSYSVKHAYLDQPIIARFVKFHTLQWNGHPSFRVELIGCQGCNMPIGLPPFGKFSASSEKGGRGSCKAADGHILTHKAWCAKQSTLNQWLQIDLGPPTLITGVVTKGRGDGRQNQWVVRYRLSYSNDSHVWYFYKDPSHPEVKRQWMATSSDRHAVTSTNTTNFAAYIVPDQHSPEGLEFGANSDSETARYHYLNSPFVARFVRFHPTHWKRRIGLRAGLIGCPQEGDCEAGFMRINDFAPCVENMAYNKESWISNRRQVKRHVRARWKHGDARRAVDGVADSSLETCTVLDNFDVDRPVWMVNLGRKVKIAGVVILTWFARRDQQPAENTTMTETSYRDYMYNVDQLTLYADNKAGRGQYDLDENLCGSVSRFNDALFRRRLHVPCRQPIRARYLYVEARGVADRYSRLFSAVICEVMVYE